MIRVYVLHAYASRYTMSMMSSLMRTVEIELKVETRRRREGGEACGAQGVEQMREKRNP